MVLKGLIFCHFTLCEGIVDLKGLILNNFHFRMVWWSRKDCFWIIGRFGLQNHNIQNYKFSPVCLSMSL